MKNKTTKLTKNLTKEQKDKSVTTRLIMSNQILPDVNSICLALSFKYPTDYNCIRYGIWKWKKIVSILSHVRTSLLPVIVNVPTNIPILLPASMASSSPSFRRRAAHKPTRRINR